MNQLSVYIYSFPHEPPSHWVSSDSLCFSRNLSILTSFSNMLIYNFSQYFLILIVCLFVSLKFVTIYTLVSILVILRFFYFFLLVQFSSVTQSCLTLCNPMNCSMPGLPVHHHPGVHPNQCPSSRWCHPAISFYVIPFSSCPQSLPASESFPMSQLFAWGGQSIGVSASALVLPKNT